MTNHTPDHPFNDLTLACRHYICTLDEFGPDHKYTDAARMQIRHALGIFGSPATSHPATSAESTAGEIRRWFRRLLVPRNWWNEFAAAVEDTAIKAREIERLREQMKRASVAQVDIALHVYADRKRDLSDKGAMRMALDEAFKAFQRFSDDPKYGPQRLTPAAHPDKF